MVDEKRSPSYSPWSIVRAKSFRYAGQHKIKYALESAVCKQMILDCIVSNTASG
jgi:hypothetical protein